MAVVSRRKKFLVILIIALLFVGMAIAALVYFFKPDPVVWAITSNEPTYLEKILKDGADVNYTRIHAMARTGTFTNNTVRLAVDNRHDDCLEVLIDYGADVNYIDDEGDSVLMCAAGYCDSGKVALLLEAGADVEYVNEFDENAMSYALKAPYAGYGYDDAAAYEIIVMLSDREMTINEDDIYFMLDDYYNSLIFRLKVAEKIYTELLDDGAKIEYSKDQFLYNAFTYGTLPQIEEYQRQPELWEIAIYVINDDVDGLTELYQKYGRECLEKKSTYNETLLMIAAAFDSEECAEFLILNGANVKAQSDFTMDGEAEMTAVDYAEKYESDNVLRILQEYQP